jgi:hypothetical protein
MLELQVRQNCRLELLPKLIALVPQLVPLQLVIAPLQLVVQPIGSLQLLVIPRRLYLLTTFLVEQAMPPPTHRAYGSYAGWLT